MADFALAIAAPGGLRLLGTWRGPGRRLNIVPVKPVNLKE